MISRKFFRIAIVFVLFTSIVFGSDQFFTGRAFSAEHSLVWSRDYGQAMQTAKKQRKTMFIYFYDPQGGSSYARFEKSVLNNPALRLHWRPYILVKVPVNYEIRMGGRKTRLLSHPSFAAMEGGAGVAIIDTNNPRSPYHGYVVSAVPFGSSARLGLYELSVLLTLPRGSLTQRSMIFAVRIHPERPASTRGQFHPALAHESASHSWSQASMTVQGHHNFNVRFSRINARLPGTYGAQEVVAESWPGQGLMDACVECVRSWRQSSGHWIAVQSHQTYYAYDVKRGRNGVWYATGLFAR